MGSGGGREITLSLSDIREAENRDLRIDKEIMQRVERKSKRNYGIQKELCTSIAMK